MTENRKSSILIVDDDKNNLFVLNSILEKNYTIFTAKSGQNGLKIAASLKPDLILLDIIMPDMSGFDVLRRLKEMDELMDIPVIFITGLASVEDEARGFRLGAADYITKPFHNTIVEVRVNSQINQVRHRRVIEMNALLDSLTSIPNRRSYDKQINILWSAAILNAQPLALIRADVDNLKGYNDSLGHMQGDSALQSLANALADTLPRPTDFVARVGGDDFAVLLPNTDTEAALEIAENLLACVRGLGIPHPDAKGAGVFTISMGVTAMTPTENDSMQEFVERADKALMNAKEEGCDRVVQAAPAPRWFLAAES